MKALKAVLGLTILLLGGVLLWTFGLVLIVNFIIFVNVSPWATLIGSILSSALLLIYLIEKDTKK